MLRRFPHSIAYTTEGSPGEIVDGIPTEGTPGESITAICRAEPNVRQSYIHRDDDGQRIVFEWLIHLDKSTDKVPFGQEVTITEDGTTIATGTVKRSFKNQLHNQIWI